MKITKFRIYLFLVLISVLGSVVLVLLNISYIERYQIKYRNDIRARDIKVLAEGIKMYITEKNNCPMTSNPVPRTFLPELVFDGSGNPKGGVNISTLENMEDYIDLQKKDPSGGPYLIGTYGNKIYIYTNNFEVYKSNNQTIFELIETDLCNQIPS